MKKKEHKPKVERKNQKGFSLLELLIVVAIIAILSAIAIPRYLQARQSGIEGAGLSTTRSFQTAIDAYQTKWNQIPATLAALGGTGCDTGTAATATSACLLDNSVVAAAGAGFNGYAFTYATASGSWTLNADPVAGGTAKRHFFTAGGAIHYNDTAAAAATDTVVGN